ncbi:ATP-dependent helicase HrpB [Thermophagus sp. OGC60D27]|uniref:ATP-dependent helicase HrpB n=1 Tax=Thermophagus sp. OGC60D27 TaxID=3458415 RepID=UPI0040380460
MAFDILEILEVNLPVKEIIPEVRKRLTKENKLMISAPPGAGKSTLLPLALMNEPWLGSKKILMLEPRRLAARSIAYRMSSLLHEEIGERVGYRIRFEKRISNITRIEVVTEGILTRMLQSDNALEDVGMIIFDEYHERSLFADVSLVLSLESQQVLRPDLRLVIMSATLNIPQLKKILNIPVIESKGKQYPIEIIHRGPRDIASIPENVAHTILDSLKRDEGDVLAFLPGESEIRRCEEILKTKTKEISIHPLYGQLPQKAQLAAIMPHSKGRRKVVLSTSIAETSLTIEGISVVIDSGFGRTLRYDPGTGLSRLTTIEITLDVADQRAGRAGRLGRGKCYRLWTAADEHRMGSHRIPEIEESDLASLMLDLALWGISDPYELNWPTPPPLNHIKESIETLQNIGALENNRITTHGKEMAKLACHPRIAHMLLMAETMGQLTLAADLAAILQERDPMPRDTGIDINLRIAMLRRLRREGRHIKRWQQIIRLAEFYTNMFGKRPENGPFDPYDTGFLLVNAYPERIAFARPGNGARFQLSNGSYVMASHEDDLAHEPWLSVAHMDARNGLGKIFLASPLDPGDLKSMAKTTDIVAWDIKSGGLVAVKNLCIGSIVLKTVPKENPDPELVVKSLCEVLKKEGKKLLDFNDEVEQWQNRVLSLRHWRPEENWPDVSTTTLLEYCEKWLMPYLTGIKRNEDLKKINLLEVLHYHLPTEKQKSLDLLAPRIMEVPSGSKLKLKYYPDGSSPVLAVRLQEVFGMKDTPRVNEGKIPVLLHLLSPGFKPVQITSDLRSFWNNTYFEVRNELKNRYPKHVWPDDPWKEKAIRGPKRRR